MVVVVLYSKGKFIMLKIAGGGENWRGGAKLFTGPLYIVLLLSNQELDS